MAKGENGAKADNGAPAGGTTTAIGPTIVIKGKLRSDEDLIVKGRIEAEISSSKALLVENSGIIKANIRVKSARISGVLVGNVTAEERVEIAPDGRMVGDLTAPKIIINDGAAFRGRIDMQNFEASAEAKPARSSEASAPAKQAPTGGDHPPAAAHK
jgi:cytoskeletal protein CcmA (bactofilin family)